MNLILTAMAAAAVSAGAATDQDCRSTPDCASTYQPFVELFDARWDMDRYRAFLTRYNEVSRDRDYTLAAQASEPQRPASPAEWYERWHYRRPHNMAPWTLAYTTLRDEVFGFINGYNGARSRAAELRALTDHDTLRSRLRERVSEAFPGAMGRERFRVADVIYVYMGAAERDFLVRKLAYLDAAQDGRLPQRGFTAQDAALYAGGAATIRVMARAQTMADALGATADATAALFLGRREQPVAAVAGGAAAGARDLAAAVASPVEPARPVDTARPIEPARVVAPPVAVVEPAAPRASADVVRAAVVAPRTAAGNLRTRRMSTLTADRDAIRAALRTNLPSAQRRALIAQRARIQAEINRRSALAADARRRRAAAEETRRRELRSLVVVAHRTGGDEREPEQPGTTTMVTREQVMGTPARRALPNCSDPQFARHAQCRR